MKTVIEMAREAGFTQPEGETWYEAFPQCIERFAALVAAAEQKKWQDQAMVDIHEAVLDEREACLYAAKVAVSLLSDPIEAIRARGNT